MEPNRRRARRWTAVLAIPLGLGLSAALIWQNSQAAFTAQTSNAGNSFAAGTVALTDDDTGTFMFSVTGLKPGDTGQKCIAVTYGGSLNAAVKLFVAPGDLTGTGLGAYLNLTVEEGTVGAFASCGAFVATATDVPGTLLSTFAGASTNSATGVGNFNPAGGSGASKVYRFTYTLADDNAAMGKNATVKFTWEASST
jgi:Camelysin metallo-endopeptidase